MRSECVDQAPPFQRLDAVDQIGRYDEAAALVQDFSAAVDRHFEAAFGNIARLYMRVEMRSTNGACLERNFHHHHLGQIGHDPAGHTRLRVYPFGAFGRYEEIA